MRHTGSAGKDTPYLDASSPPPVPSDSSSDLSAALAAVRARTDLVPRVALVLGSGLGDLARSAEDAVTIATADLPGYPRSTVVGHAGQLVLGTLEGVPVLFVNGRAHYYEGHSPLATTFPVRLAHALGAGRILLTNAAGGINRTYKPGTLMLIDDHITFAFVSPLAGPVIEGMPRFPDMSAPYSRAWSATAEAAALRLGIDLRRGTYLWTSGPSYETKAEIRAFAALGADAVGMSTVPEAIAAHALGMEVLGLSTITNFAAGLGQATLDHTEVLEVGQQVRGALERLVRALVVA